MVMSVMSCDIARNEYDVYSIIFLFLLLFAVKNPPCRVDFEVLAVGVQHSVSSVFLPYTSEWLFIFCNRFLYYCQIEVYHLRCVCVFGEVC